MRRTLDELREYLLSLANHVEFFWNGTRGFIDPYTREKYLFFFGENDPGTEFHSADELLNAPYMGGHSIAEVCKEIEFWS